MTLDSNPAAKPEQPEPKPDLAKPLRIDARRPIQHSSERPWWLNEVTSDALSKSDTSEDHPDEFHESGDRGDKGHPLFATTLSTEDLAAAHDGYEKGVPDGYPETPELLAREGYESSAAFARFTEQVRNLGDDDLAALAQSVRESRESRQGVQRSIWDVETARANFLIRKHLHVQELGVGVDAELAARDLPESTLDAENAVTWKALSILEPRFEDESRRALAEPWDRWYGQSHREAGAA